ncbi:Transposase IS200 like protein [Marinomonas gallaica]|uniref:Transposase IS200 like protein n=1 Tax=Marinomonas gallaica TaxID=1806667 RepID=A0A1C3JV15_9GAMM|nr:Transposase IS200 like protein [Marinomonas gallaica]SBT21884.1 Transposase IS200 like protein [Marinomonas gallaica]
MYVKGHSALRRGRQCTESDVFHVVIKTRNNHPFFNDFYLARSLVKTLMFCEEHCFCRTVAFCIMPDHVHWLVQPLNKSLSKLIYSVKKQTSSERLKWARSFYDCGIRNESQLINTARYIIANPKRAGIVASVNDYPHWDCIYVS